MYSVGDRVMVDGASFGDRHEGIIQKIAENEKSKVMYLVLGDGYTRPFWQSEEMVFAIKSDD
jgi:hypothetical protein